MAKEKTIHQLGGEAVKKKYGNGHFKKLADIRWEKYRKLQKLNKKKK